MGRFSGHIERRIFNAVLLVLAACERPIEAQTQTQQVAPPSDAAVAVMPVDAAVVATGDAKTLCANHKKRSRIDRKQARQGKPPMEGNSVHDSAFWDSNNGVAVCTIVHERARGNVVVMHQSHWCPQGGGTPCRSNVRNTSNASARGTQDCERRREKRVERLVRIGLRHGQRRKVVPTAAARVDDHAVGGLVIVVRAHGSNDARTGTSHAFRMSMPSTRAPEAHPEPPMPARPPQSSQNGAPDPAPDPAGQSPDAPIEFTSGDDVARGNAERANAEPEPAARHAAVVPGKPDAAKRRHEVAKHHDR